MDEPTQPRQIATSTTMPHKPYGHQKKASALNWPDPHGRKNIRHAGIWSRAPPFQSLSQNISTIAPRVPVANK